MRKWEDIRKMGKWRFVFVQGVLRWGISFGILFSLMRYFLNGEPVGNLLWPVPIYLGGGAVWGIWVWDRNEKKYANKALGETEAG